MSVATPPASPPHAPTATEAPQPLHGLIGEFETVDSVMKAARVFRDAGFKHWDVHAPFPIHGIDDAMGTRPTILPWIVLAGGITGCLSGAFLTHYTMGVRPDWPWLIESLKGYEYFISGKPLFSTPAYIPPMFEMTILFSAFGAVFGMFLLNKLPLLYHPLFKSDRFKRATSDRFFIAVEARDPKFDEAKTAELLEQAGATYVERVTQ
jgi:hypothetical protein